MNIYIDESGSINNHLQSGDDFVIALIRVTDPRALKSSIKRFVKKYKEELKELDKGKFNSKTGRQIAPGGKMFQGERFIEFKGSMFDREMKKTFVNYFAEKPSFEIYYIRIRNHKLSDKLCKTPSIAFNYVLKNALSYFLTNGYLPMEPMRLQLDERNEKTNLRYFLQQYLNTEFIANGIFTEELTVEYFDSANNQFIQIADVFSNLYFSNLKTSAYKDEINLLRHRGILKTVFTFPL